MEEIRRIAFRRWNSRSSEFLAVAGNAGVVVASNSRIKGGSYTDSFAITRLEPRDTVAVSIMIRDNQTVQYRVSCNAIINN